jgi:hypothetical protein
MRSIARPRFFCPRPSRYFLDRGSTRHANNTRRWSSSSILLPSFLGIKIIIGYLGYNGEVFNVVMAVVIMFLALYFLSLVSKW